MGTSNKTYIKCLDYSFQDIKILVLVENVEKSLNFLVDLETIIF